MDFTKIDASLWINVGALILLAAVLAGVGRFVKSVADAWLEEYRKEREQERQRSIEEREQERQRSQEERKRWREFMVKMTEFMANLSVNLEQLNREHGDLKERVDDHEKGSARRYNEIRRGLSGGLGWNRNNDVDS